MAKLDASSCYFRLLELFAQQKNGERDEKNGDRLRDEYDLALVRAFVAAGKPVFGICRGLQLVNVAHGGTLGHIALVVGLVTGAGRESFAVPCPRSSVRILRWERKGIFFWYSRVYSSACFI